MSSERRRRLLLGDPELRIAADELALYGAHCTIERVSERPSEVSDFALWLDAEGLALLAPGFATEFRLSQDELVARRRVATELTRACGALGQGDTVADPFAGFAIDALTLAGTGATVTAAEREPIVYLLMRDFVRRCQARVTPVLGDGVGLLGEGARFDVVYLDPMFEPRRKRALPNRGLQHLRELTTGEDIDMQALLARARASARRRVVLKRRPKDPTIDKPSHAVTGKAVRFDVYT